MTDPAAPDALTLIFSAGAGCISVLTGLVVVLARGHMKTLQDEVKSLRSALEGREGLIVKLTELLGKATNAESRLTALETKSLTRELFDSAINKQNSDLEALKETTKETERQVQRLNIKVGSHPTPMARGYLPPSDPPRKR